MHGLRVVDHMNGVRVRVPGHNSSSVRRTHFEKGKGSRQTTLDHGQYSWGGNLKYLDPRERGSSASCQAG